MAATKKAVDLSDVRDRGAFNPIRVAAGDYLCIVEKVDDHVKEGEKVSTQWVFTIKIKGKRGTYSYYCSHTDKKQFWKIYNLFTAAGLAVPKKRLMIDPNKIVGKEIGAAFDDDEYEGRIKSTIVGVFPVSDLPKDAPKQTASNDADDDEDSTDDDTDDVDDLDLEEV